MSKHERPIHLDGIEDCFRSVKVKVSSIITTDCLTYRARWVKTNGQKYNPMCALVVGVDHEYPQFGKVINILAK